MNLYNGIAHKLFDRSLASAMSSFRCRVEAPGPAERFLTLYEFPLLITIEMILGDMDFYFQRQHFYLIVYVNDFGTQYIFADTRKICMPLKIRNFW